jgi:tetratricopeptide (TPR) repeat protein
MDKLLYPDRCQIDLEPETRAEEDFILFSYYQTLKRVESRADITLSGTRVDLAGRGYDGRCAFCRQFRCVLRREGIKEAVNCPLERRNGNGGVQVRIGDAFFARAYLEDDRVLCRYLETAAADPNGIEAHLALGVMHEYRGQYPLAIGAYWQAHQLDPANKFPRERLREILLFLSRLLKLKKDSAARCRN